MRIEELTFLRFVAAAIVVIFHFGRDATGFSGALTSGSEMVTFFFVLSGFVLGIAYFEKEMPMAKFYWARLARILPVYLLALSLVVAIYLIHDRDIDPTALALHFTLLQSWVTSYPITLNSPGWSLSVEALFYLSFPVLLLLIKNKKLSYSFMAMFSLGLWVVTHAMTTFLINTYDMDANIFEHHLIYYFPLTHFCSFLLGFSGAIWVLKNHDRQYSELLIGLFLLFTFVSIVLILNNKESIVDVWFKSIIPPFFTSHNLGFHNQVKPHQDAEVFSFCHSRTSELLAIYSTNTNAFNIYKLHIK
jgi:peptidoglycan/LPS O-acetylase OafA/YrhL